MSAEMILIILNLMIGFGVAVPIAVSLRHASVKPTGFIGHFVFLIVVYFTESIALAMGMGIPILNIALAFVWGLILASRLRTRIREQELPRQVLSLSLYSCLPAVSFIAVPVLMWIDGRHILSAAEGIRFGIPAFLHLPWPLNTILGFYLSLVVGAVVLKTLITTGAARRRLMKKAVVLMLALGPLVCPAVDADDSYQTTAKLPEDRQIWPIPEVETAGDIFAVEAEFIESKEILSVTQGNWKTVTCLVRYKVTGKDTRYPYEDIIFIAKDTWPAEGSNIKLKKLMWPFKTGNRFFYLKREKECRFKAYFDILTYS